MSKKDKRPHPKPPSEPTLRPDAEVYIEQARWLLEWHNRRSEAFVNRAVGVIGFDGVALALRTGAEIVATDEVLDEVGIESTDDDEDEVAKFKEFLDEVSPEDFE